MATENGNQPIELNGLPAATIEKTQPEETTIIADLPEIRRLAIIARLRLASEAVTNGLSKFVSRPDIADKVELVQRVLWAGDFAYKLLQGTILMCGSTGVSMSGGDPTVSGSLAAAGIVRSMQGLYEMNMNLHKRVEVGKHLIVHISRNPKLKHIELSDGSILEPAQKVGVL